MKKTVLTVTTGLLLIFSSAGAWAITVTFDQAALTVVRPGPGEAPVFVTFTGQVVLDPGFVVGSVELESALTSTGELLIERLLAAGNNFLSIEVRSTDSLGLYAFDGAGGTSDITFRECPVNDLFQCPGRQSATAAYSLNVVAAQNIPEPSALALAAIGLAGLGFSRRKRISNKNASPRAA